MFGKAADFPDKLARTLFCVMVKCHFSNAKFLALLIPCHALNAAFAFNILTKLITDLENSGAHVISIIQDNCRVNQSIFSKFTPVNPNEPWIVKSPGEKQHDLFLIYDPVHILKNIRNSWHTEKLQTLTFFHNSETKFACWNDLITLYNHESSHLLKLSCLTKSTVFPRHVEKQKVPLVLNIFCDKTAAALKTSEASNPSSLDTATFIQYIVKLWKLLNCKSRFAVQYDKDRLLINSLDCDGLQLLSQWANNEILPPGTTNRMKTLAKDTSVALVWTCNALAALCKHLLLTDAPYRHQYVLLGFYQQDDLERHFGHFRMSAGGNYYITTKDIFMTHNLDRARTILNSCEDIDLTLSNNSHLCELCKQGLSDVETLIIDDLLESKNLIEEIDNDTKLSLFYIGGYIAYKHEELRGEARQFDENITSYLETLNRGSLHYPTPGLFDILLITYLFITRSNTPMCRNRLLEILEVVPDFFGLDLHFDVIPMRRVANIFLKRFCLQSNSGPSDNELERKLYKLASKSKF